MQIDKIVNVKIAPGHKVTIEHTSVDTRETIEAVVSCSTLDNGKGVAVFSTEDGQVFTWKPSFSSSHGEVVRIDCARPDVLINAYVRAFSTEVQQYRPVHVNTGEYTYTEKVCETHNWSEALAPHGDHICLDCRMVVNDKFEFGVYYGD